MLGDATAMARGCCFSFGRGSLFPQGDQASNFLGVLPSSCPCPCVDNQFSGTCLGDPSEVVDAFGRSLTSLSAMNDYQRRYKGGRKDAWKGTERFLTDLEVSFLRREMEAKDEKSRALRSGAGGYETP